MASCTSLGKLRSKGARSSLLARFRRVPLPTRLAATPRVVDPADLLERCGCNEHVLQADRVVEDIDIDDEVDEVADAAERCEKEGVVGAALRDRVATEDECKGS